jgi:hypothetical protein
VADIPPAAVQAAAEVMLRQYESQYEAGHLTWRGFEDDARQILEAAREAETTLPTAAQIRVWLRTAGWHPEPPGPAGTLWHPPGHAAPVAVPHGDEDTMTVAGAVRRVAQRMGLPVDEVTAEMRNLGETDG